MGPGLGEDGGLGASLAGEGVGGVKGVVVVTRQTASAEACRCGVVAPQTLSQSSGSHLSTT